MILISVCYPKTDHLYSIVSNDSFQQYAWKACKTFDCYEEGKHVLP
jgi:hypothetical protein